MARAVYLVPGFQKWRRKQGMRRRWSLPCRGWNGTRP